MTRDDWKAVQRRLAKLGFNPGPIDGIRGKMTTNAVRRFQESRGLVSDGIVGPKTHRALFGKPARGHTPNYDNIPWFDEAMRLVGTKEVVGPGSNQIILDMARDLKLDYKDDDIPWCGLFTGHCIGSTLNEEALPANLLGARNWLKFGEECTPQIGAVMVFWRVKKSGWKGHVGFYAGEDSSDYYVLGGNQDNSVNVTKISKSRLLGARWPITGPSPTGAMTVDGVVAVPGDGDEQ